MPPVTIPAAPPALAAPAPVLSDSDALLALYPGFDPVSSTLADGSPVTVAARASFTAQGRALEAVVAKRRAPDGSPASLDLAVFERSATAFDRWIEVPGVASAAGAVTLVAGPGDRLALESGQDGSVTWHVGAAGLDRVDAAPPDPGSFPPRDLDATELAILRQIYPGWNSVDARLPAVDAEGMYAFASVVDRADVDLPGGRVTVVEACRGGDATLMSPSVCDLAIADAGGRVRVFVPGFSGHDVNTGPRTWPRAVTNGAGQDLLLLGGFYMHSSDGFEWDEVWWLHGTRLARVSRYAVEVSHDESACGVGDWPDSAVGPDEPQPCVTFAATADGYSTREVGEDGRVTTRAWRFGGVGWEAMEGR